MAEAPGSSWQDYFDPGERLLWEGAPDGRVHIGPGGLFTSLFGLPFLAGGLLTFGAGVGSFAGGFGNFGGIGGGFFAIMFSLPFLAVGTGLTVGPWLAGPVGARRVRYALSDRRAYVAKRFWGRTLESYPILSDAAVELDQGRRVDTVRLYSHDERDSEGDRTHRQVCFDMISDGKAVYDLIRAIQRGDI